MTVTPPGAKLSERSKQNLNLGVGCHFTTTWSVLSFLRPNRSYILKLRAFFAFLLPTRRLVVVLIPKLMSSTTSCLRCGHPFDGSREVERLLGHTIKDVLALGIQQEGDVAAIQVEVRLLDDLIRRLNQNRARLLQKVNNLQAKTRRLPPEVLSTIFQLAHPPIDVGTRSIPAEFRKDLRRYAFTEEEEEEEGEEFQLVLGAVSHHWRQVAWATPQLWTTISIEAHETVGESNVSLLSLYFENSRNLPMTVVLDFRDQLELMMDRKGKEPSWFIKSLEDLFRDNAAKIRNFTMTGIPIEWTHLIRESFSRCESMTLYWSSSPHQPTVRGYSFTRSRSTP